MKRAKIARGILGVFAFVSALLLAGHHSMAQETARQEVYQAQAMGQGTQMRQSFNVTARIVEYSTPEDRQVLLEAFNTSGSKGMFNALEKMESKGR